VRVDLEREQDVERLRQAARLLESENQRLAAKVLELTRALSQAKGEDADALQLRISELEEQLARRNKMLFEKSSEKRSERAAPAAAARAPQKGHGPKQQPLLKVVDALHVLDEGDRKCTRCGGELKEWAGQFETSEEVDVLARTFVLMRHRRQKYRCGCGGCVETSPGPDKLFEGARYSINFAVEVAIQKYLDHLPLERQVRIMAREGLDVDSQTLWDYLERIARLLKPAHEALHDYVLTQSVVGADETRWLLMGAPAGEPGKWHVWALAAANAVVYRILDSRSADAARTVLKEYQGVVVADGYSAYQSLRKQGGSFVLAHCWAHVRREYLEILERYPQAAAVLDLIGELYEIEKQCPTGPPGDELRLQLRREKSRPIVARIHEWALAQRALPESGLGKAISYMGGMWPGLILFLEDARIPLDNNAVERALRGPVVGRKNHYGSRSQRGTEVAALMYSLCETAKLCGIEPKAYLRFAVRAALAGERVRLPHELPAAA
jgi:transposase